jgi:hypothetical protein
MNIRIFSAVIFALLASSFAWAEDGKVTFLSPQDGAEVSIDKPVTVSFEAVWGPKGNHLHLYLDDHRVDVIRQAKGSEDIRIAKPGKHEICLEIETSWHFSTGVRQCVTVTAK